MKALSFLLLALLLILWTSGGAEFYAIYGNLNSSGSFDVSTHYSISGSAQGVYAFNATIPIVHGQLTSPVFQTITNEQFGYSPFPNASDDAVDSNANPCKYLIPLSNSRSMVSLRIFRKTVTSGSKSWLRS